MTPSLRQRLAEAAQRQRNGSGQKIVAGDQRGIDHGSLTTDHCLFAARAKCCGKKFECRRIAGLPRVVSAKECNPDCPQRVERMRISAVIIAWNEGDEVKKTVQSLMASIQDPRTELEIIVVDDGSVDDSCQWAVASGQKTAFVTDRCSLVTLRHDTPLGVGRSRNAGWHAALAGPFSGCPGHVVTFHDAHMRFPCPEPGRGAEGGIEKLARRALQSEAQQAIDRRPEAVGTDLQPTVRQAHRPELSRRAAPSLQPPGAIVFSGSNGFPKQKKNRLFCCDMFYNRKDGFQPKWLYIAKPPPADGPLSLGGWTRSPCMMGAGYVMSRATAQALEDATGNLWEDIAGRWGFSEQALSIKAFLLDIPVLSSHDVVIRHWYSRPRPDGAIPDAGTDNRRNVCRATCVLFGRKVWEQRFKPWCLKWLSAREVKQISTQAFKEQDGRDPPSWKRWKRPVSEVFTHLCGKRAPITEPHPDHAWLSEVKDEVRRMKSEVTNNEQRAINNGPVRVLQWRPGESTLLVRRLLPKAEILTIEMPGHRADNWWDICPANGVQIQKAVLNGDYATRPRQWAQNGGKFDLVLVGGEMQDECKAVAQDLLAQGGQVLVNPSADRLQIEDAELKKERKDLKTVDSGQKSVDSKRPAPPATDGRPLVTVALLNYQRPENIGPVLNSIAEQTIKTQVVLWNNGDPLQFQRPSGPPCRMAEHELVSVAVQSSKNVGCFPRWLLAALADTEFVCSMDDDLVFKDKNVLADAVAACREECPDGIVGFFGWSARDGKDYRHGRHHNGTTHGTACDIIKGRFMLFRRALLERVPMEIPGLNAVEGLSHREDDVYLSLCISGGRPDWHRIPARLGHRWKELSQHGVSASSESGHYKRRDEYIRRIKEWLKSAPPRRQPTPP